MKLVKRHIPTIYFVLGTYLLLFPIISGWTEVVFKRIYRQVLLPIDWGFFIIFQIPLFQISDDLGQVAEEILLLMISALYLIYSWVRIKKSLGENVIRYVLPVGLIILIWGAVLTLGKTSTMRRVNSFAIGGWTRIIMAGGQNAIRESAFGLLESSAGGKIYDSDIPETLDLLGNWVSIDKKQELVIVGLGSAYGMGAEFGFSIQKESQVFQVPSYFNEEEFYREWKLVDNIFFWQR